MIKAVSAAVALTLLASPVLAQQRDNLEILVGEWSRDDGSTVLIKPSVFGWDLWHSQLGQMSIVPDSKAGSNIKVSGQGYKTRQPIDCYYRISINSPERMTWGLKDGPPEECGKALTIYTAVPGMKSRSQEVADAQAYRANIVDRITHGPVDLTGVDIVYFERPADNNRVRDALDLARIAFTVRPSGSPTQSNVITCQRDTPIEATRAFARALIKAQVPIRVIRPAQPDLQIFVKRLTVESLDQWTLHQPLVTLDDVDRLTTCNFHNIDGRQLAEPVSGSGQIQPKVRVSLGEPLLPSPNYASPQNFAPPPAPPVPEIPVPQSYATREPITVQFRGCRDSNYNVTARYWSPATGSWQMAHLRDVGSGMLAGLIDAPPQPFTLANGSAIMTSTREVYYAVRNLSRNELLRLPGPPVRFPGGDTDFYKRSNNLVVTCGRS